MKLLVVEDEAEIAGTLGQYAQRNGYEVSTAYDGLTAVEMARAQRPDVILLDVNIPGLDGRDVMARLKKEGVVDDTVVVFVTGRDGQYDRLLGLELGADDYETKPLHLGTLFLKIESLLEKKRGR